MTNPFTFKDDLRWVTTLTWPSEYAKENPDKVYYSIVFNWESTDYPTYDEASKVFMELVDKWPIILTEGRTMFL